MFCAKCGSSNDEAANFCVSCGYALPLSDQAATVSHGEAASDEEYYKAIIGPKNQDYYLDHFSRFDDEGKISPTWNWSAFFVTFYWMLYRKMWMPAAIYFFLPYLLMLLSGIVAAVAGSVLGVFVSLGYFLYFGAIFIGAPMYANALYYKHCKKTIAAVRSTTPGTQRQLDELDGKGGTSKIVLIIIAIIAIVAVVGILAAVAIPAYQDYTSKARMVQAANTGKLATDYVDDYFKQYRSIPRSLEASNFASTLPPAIAAVNVDSRSGVITLTMIGSVAIHGKSLKYVPALEGDDQLSWTCMSDEIQDRYLPQNCRQPK
jgi:Tfp pilus assembly protein PilE